MRAKLSPTDQDVADDEEDRRVAFRMALSRQIGDSHRSRSDRGSGERVYCNAVSVRPAGSDSVAIYSRSAIIRIHSSGNK